MQPTVVCALTLPSDIIRSGSSAETVFAQARYYDFWRDVAVDESNPFIGLLNLFDHADLIVGYNALGFDFPLLKRFYHRKSGTNHPTRRYTAHRAKTLDIFNRVRDVTGEYFKLDTLLQRNNLAQKTGDGKQAVVMWEKGLRQELCDYCMSDVVLTAKLALLPSIQVDQHRSIGAPCVGLRAALSAVPRDGDDEGFVLL